MIPGVCFPSVGCKFIPFIFKFDPYIDVIITFVINSVLIDLLYLEIFKKMDQNYHYI